MKNSNSIYVNSRRVPYHGEYTTYLFQTDVTDEEQIKDVLRTEAQRIFKDDHNCFWYSPRIVSLERCVGRYTRGDKPCDGWLYTVFTPYTD